MIDFVLIVFSRDKKLTYITHFYKKLSNAAKL